MAKTKEETKAPVVADPEMPDAAETYAPGDAPEIPDPLALLDAAHAAASHPDYLRNSPLQTLMRAFLAERPNIVALQGRMVARAKAKAEHLRRVEAYEREQAAKEKAEKAKMAG